MLCTYRRPIDVERCIRALALQTRLPDELLVVVRDEDVATQTFVARMQPPPFPVRIIMVHTAGLVAARNAGLDAVRSDIIAMIDDDTAPLPEWLDRICTHFETDSTVGAVGGRDRPAGPHAGAEVRQPTVGILQIHGRYIGNHHCGIGPPRPVDLLKGANMSYRAAAVASLRFDKRLLGRGAQPCEDLAFSLAVRGAGWKLIYDPEVVLDHYEGDREELRHYAGMMPIKDGDAFGEMTYNWVVAIWDHISVPRHVLHIIWQVLVGTRARFGLLQALRFLPALKGASWQRFWYTQKALFRAYVHLGLRRGTERKSV
nr:glycosyltransferase family 2 protein [Terriglobus roseus]